MLMEEKPESLGFAGPKIISNSFLTYLFEDCRPKFDLNN